MDVIRTRKNKRAQERGMEMAFAMRMNLNGSIVKKETFRNIYINGARNGFEFDVQLGYYRGHYLSTIDLLEVYLNGEKQPEEAVTFEVNGKELPLYKLKYAVTEFWRQVDPAKVRAIRKGGVSDGEHELDFRLTIHIPYMQIGPGHDFMPLDSGEKVTVVVKEQKEGRTE